MDGPGWDLVITLPTDDKRWYFSLMPAWWNLEGGGPFEIQEVQYLFHAVRR